MSVNAWLRYLLTVSLSRIGSVADISPQSRIWNWNYCLQHGFGVSEWQAQLISGFVSLIRMSEEMYHMEVVRLMGAKYGSNAINNNTRKKEENQVPPGWTRIICQRCGRNLGQVYSTNGIVTCDKCGRRSYIRIRCGVEVILPVSYLGCEGYYDETDRYFHRMEELVKSEQIPIEDGFGELE